MNYDLLIFATGFLLGAWVYYRGTRGASPIPQVKLPAMKQDKAKEENDIILPKVLP